MKNGLEVDESGCKYYYLNDFLHREDGPAAIDACNNKSWYQNGKLHRLDGPAIELTCGRNSWFFKGIKIHCKSQEEFERIIKLKEFW